METSEATILVVDDEDVNLQGIQNALELDYNIICASNGAGPRT